MRRGRPEASFELPLSPARSLPTVSDFPSVAADCSIVSHSRIRPCHFLRRSQPIVPISPIVATDGSSFSTGRRGWFHGFPRSDPDRSNSSTCCSRPSRSRPSRSRPSRSRPSHNPTAPQPTAPGTTARDSPGTLKPRMRRGKITWHGGDQVRRWQSGLSSEHGSRAQQSGKTITANNSYALAA